MKKIIHHIRSKHPQQRDRYIWIIAAISIGVLLIIWAIVGNGRKANPDENFFQSFDQGLQEGKDTFEPNPLGQ